MQQARGVDGSSCLRARLSQVARTGPRIVFVGLACAAARDLLRRPASIKRLVRAIQACDVVGPVTVLAEEGGYLSLPAFAAILS